MGELIEKARMPIGVFDSGVGGISVLRELAHLLPNENFIYFGDSKHAPYGTKTLEEVRRLTCADAKYLIRRGVKMLVVACNTATSAAIGLLREAYREIPVIGIEPALKPAVLSKKHPTVLVMATPMTLKEEKFHNLMRRFQSQAEIIPLPCPGLVEFVERGELEGERLINCLSRLFSEYRDRNVDAVVLGCTHYPFVRGAIEKVLGPKTAVFDGGEGTARETKRQLLNAGLLNPSEEKGAVCFENSLGTGEITALCEKLFYRS